MPARTARVQGDVVSLMVMLPKFKVAMVSL